MSREKILKSIVKIGVKRYHTIANEHRNIRHQFLKTSIRDPKFQIPLMRKDFATNIIRSYTSHQFFNVARFSVIYSKLH